ncbi:MAG: serine/threonine protein kinase [Betaproteobacteria bacterium]|nr:serine/threonine protein kinase [Betaproteobacteria bacterium]MDH3436845.1 serine/threonine protein kinase [Betaproteobacteria bacterium]
MDEPITKQSIKQHGLPSKTLLLEYRIESILGAGGFGITYLARDTHLEKDVAIKEYLPVDLALRALDRSVVPVNTDTAFNYKSGLDLFLAEARTLARFTHPNIVRVSRYFEANGTAYMVMSYEEGTSLNRFLRKAAQPDEAYLKAMVEPLLEGLQEVHAAGFLHRDIKPSNIFLRADGTPVLLDFGTARLAIRDSVHDAIAILTPGYAPVELYVRTGRQGPWTDVYSLAAVLYRAVVGENPPDALTRLKVDGVGKRLQRGRDRFSAKFLAAIQWGLALEEKRRPQNVTEWRSAIVRGAQPRVAAAKPEAGPKRGPAESAPDGERKYLWMALGIVVFFVIIEGTDIVQQRAGRVQAPPAKALLERKSVRAPAPGGVQSVPSGGLTPQEFAENFPHLAGKFSTIDANRDGRVSSRELWAYRERENGQAPPVAR